MRDMERTITDWSKNPALARHHSRPSQSVPSHRPLYPPIKPIWLHAVFREWPCPFPEDT